MCDLTRYFQEVDVMVRQGIGVYEACEIAKTHYPNLQREIKKTAQGSQNKLNSTITDIEKNYNIDNGQVYEEKSGKSADVTAEEACKYIFKGWNNG